MPVPVFGSTVTRKVLVSDLRVVGYCVAGMLRRLCVRHRQIIVVRDIIQHAAFATSTRNNCRDSSEATQYDLTSYKLPFNHDEESYIISTINSITAADLARLKVTKRIINQLMKGKAEVGGFTDLAELLYVDGLGIKAVENLCRALLQEREGKEAEDEEKNLSDVLHKSRKKRLVKPRVDAAQLEGVRTMVSIHVTAGSLAWAKIDRSGRVQDLSVEELLNSSSRFDAPKIYSKVMDVASRIPNADLYVWEERDTQPLVKVPLSTIIIALQLAQIKGMLMVLLESRLKGEGLEGLEEEEEGRSEVGRLEEEEEEMDTDGLERKGSGHLIYMKENIVSKLFMLKRGSERTSGIKLADELMRGHQLLPWLPPLYVEEEVEQRYFSTHPSLRRHTATAMFIGLAFNQAIVHQNIDVLRKLI